MWMVFGQFSDTPLSTQKKKIDLSRILADIDTSLAKNDSQHNTVQRRHRYAQCPTLGGCN